MHFIQLKHNLIILKCQVIDIFLLYFRNVRWTLSYQETDNTEQQQIQHSFDIQNYSKNLSKDQFPNEFIRTEQIANKCPPNTQI